MRYKDQLINAALCIALLVLVYAILRTLNLLRNLGHDLEQQLSVYPLVTQARMRALLNAFKEKGYRTTITSTVRAELGPHGRKHAIDLNVEKDGVHYTMNTPKHQWESTGLPAVAISMGFRWGGNFHTDYMWHGQMRRAYDPVHFDTE